MDVYPIRDGKIARKFTYFTHETTTTRSPLRSPPAMRRWGAAHMGDNEAWRPAETRQREAAQDCERAVDRDQYRSAMHGCRPGPG